MNSLFSEPQGGTALDEILGGAKTLDDILSGKSAKKKDLFRELLVKIASIGGLSKVNVLVLGDTTGTGTIRYAANSYVFTDVVNPRSSRYRDISRLGEYKKIIKGKFDIVISREYKKEYMSLLPNGGIYITQTGDSSMLKEVLIDKDSFCVVLGGYQQTRVELDRELFLDYALAMVRDMVRHIRDDRELFHIPNIDRIVKVNVSHDVTVTHKGLKAAPLTSHLLDLYNKTLKVYNPLFTTYTGVIDAAHRFPATAFKGLSERIAELKGLGLKVTVAPNAQQLADRDRRKYSFLTTPLMPLLPQQAFAYVKEGDLKAKKDAPAFGVKKGKKYQVRVGWRKRKDQEKVLRGYMAIKVNGHVIYEDDQEGVEEFVRTFGMPKVGSVETLYPEVVDIWRKKVAKMFPDLVDFQREDVALAACKPVSYVAHDRGLGKTRMAAAVPKARGSKRVLVAAQRQYLDKWEDELKEIGCKVEWLIDHEAINRLKRQLREGDKPSETTFYLSSFEFLGLETDLRMDPWTCVELNKNGYLDAVVKDIRSRKCPSCGKTAKQARKRCPKCGSEEYSGRFCKACGQASYSFKREKPLTPEKCHAIEMGTRKGQGQFHSGTYPAYKRLKKLVRNFFVIVDEAQMVKNKNTLRSTAVRSLHSKGRMLVTANLMRNYPNELFWPVGWLLGFNNPMFPYKYKGGFPVFERQFGTQIYKGKNPLNDKEIWERTPEVSNLSILWKLMAPFMVRRLKEDIDWIPPKTIEPVALEMDDEHRALYLDVRQSKLDELSEELQKNNPDSRIIGANLWSLRAASTIPIANRYFPQVETQMAKQRWNKLDWVVNKVKELKAKGEKVLVFSTLVDMADYVSMALKSAGVRCERIKQSTKNRFELVRRFNADPYTTALVSSCELVGRCFDIESASHVIFTDVGWTPEEHEQAMDRALRITSEKPVQVYFLLNKSTIDEHMYELVIQKGEAIKNVLDRRVVYTPAEILIEAVQVRVAKRIISEKHESFVRPVKPQEPVEETPAKTADWSKITPIQSAEQLKLFGEAQPVIRKKAA